MDGEARRGIGSLGLIDVHSHSMLPSWIEATRARYAPAPPLLEGMAIPAWDEHSAIAVMDAHNIRAMLLSNPTGTKDFDRATAVPLARRMNEEIAGIVSRHPTRFGAFAVLPLQDIDAALAELAYALDELGFDGVCLHSSFEGAYPGDPRFYPLYAELDRRRVAAFVHPIGPDYVRHIDLPFVPPVMEFMFDSTRAATSFIVSGAQARFPDMAYIATHSGGTLPFLVHRLASLTERLGTGYGGTMSYEQFRQGVARLYFDLTASPTASSLKSLLEVAPPSQILIGFDYPMRPASSIAPALRDLDQDGLLDHCATAVAFGNALQILPRLAQRLNHATQRSQQTATNTPA